MKPSARLTLRFMSYFTVFYVLTILAFIGSSTFIYLFIKSKTSIDIHNYDAEQIESLISTNDKGKVTLQPLLKQAAKDNNGEFYVFARDMTLLWHEGKYCTLCDFTREQYLQYAKPESKIWRLENSYVLFVPNEPLKPYVDELQDVYATQGEISETIINGLLKEGITSEIYDSEWQRRRYFGERKPLLTIADIMASTHDMFEREERLATLPLAEGQTLVLRQKNAHYEPFEQVAELIIKPLIYAFLLLHLCLLLGAIILSFNISRQFVRPVVYILARIERLASFDYAIPKTSPLYTKRRKKLKRKYRLFQPVEESINHLAQRLAYNERQLAHAEQLREEWITGLSHDLKTPLSSIYGYSAMLASDYEWSPKEVQEFALTMQEKANYMDALIKDLTYTYQLKNNAIQLQSEIIDLQQWLQQFEDEQVEVKINERLPVAADKLLLQRVLENLIGNAKQYTPEGTKVCITAQLYRKKQARLQIIDYGKGIPQKELDNLFDRYYRGTNTTDDLRGTGLGLAITKQLIELHKGKIEVTSSEAGTIFTVLLPLGKM